MIMRDFKNVQPTPDKLNAWDYLSAAGFIFIILFLVFFATI
jgi:hypothetical protein